MKHKISYQEGSVRKRGKKYYYRFRMEEPDGTMKMHEFKGTESKRETEAMLKEMLEQERPDFFRIGFYKMKNPSANLHEVSISELNQMCLEYLDANFMKEFIELEKKGIAHSFQEALEKKQAVMPELEAAKAFFSGNFEKKEALAYAKAIADKVEASIDNLEINKDSVAYTFRSSLVSGIEKYFYYQKNNPKEEARFARQSKKREALIARGKTVDWKVVPKVVFDLDELKNDIVKVVTGLQARYTDYIASADQTDFEARAIEIINSLKDKASKAVYKVTPAMAKEKAIKLMEEVGIAEPRMRYYQYPFEFSGGMRQRIVIAIALSADPEILICDEPTTALDVTIQAQILELMQSLQKELGMAIIMITHDLGVVAQMCDEVIVMYAGSICEQGTADEIFYNPKHEYTKGLMRSIPTVDSDGSRLQPITGTPIDLLNMPAGCPFAPRCDAAMKICMRERCQRMQINEMHQAACWMNVKEAFEKGELEEVTE